MGSVPKADRKRQKDHHTRKDGSLARAEAEAVFIGSGALFGGKAL